MAHPEEYGRRSNRLPDTTTDMDLPPSRHFFLDPRFAEYVRRKEANPRLNPEQAFEQFRLLNTMRQDPVVNAGVPWSDPTLGAMEHEAFMRSWINRDPLTAIPAGLLAPAGYQLKKLVSPGGAQTPASLDQLGASYGGYVKGLLDLLGRP